MTAPQTTTKIKIYMSDNNKIDPEKLKQLQQLMAMQMQAQGKGGQPGSQLKGPSKWTPKGMFIAMLQNMQASVKFVDQFINFIVNRKTVNSNDVVDNARSPIIFGTYVTIIFVVIGFIWAATAPLDSAAVAIGTVISNSQRKSLNHQEGGIVKEIFVNQGDIVQKGDKLIEFDSTRIKSEHESVLNQYRAFLASEARLLAEINNQDAVDYPEFLTKDQSMPEVAKIIETQNNLFNSKKDLKKAEQDSLAQKEKQMKKQIEGLEAKKVSLIKTLEFIKDRLEATKTLNTQGYAQKAALLEYEVKEANAQSEIATTDTEIARTEQEITKNDIELLNLESKFTTQNLSELRDVQVNVSERREKFYHLSDVLDRMILRSPVDGVINNINFHTVGSVIPGGQPILEISPTDDHLIIEAKVPPKNIDSIRVGLQSKIRFSAFKSRTTPLFTGTVVALSPDIVIDQRQQMDPSLAGGYYLAKIELDKDEFNEIARTRKIELHPGMQAEVQIVTGTRTLLRYLLDPVFDAMFKGFKEK
jgi:HlyD family type I secretion membrane fusion protein